MVTNHEPPGERMRIILSPTFPAAGYTASSTTWAIAFSASSPRRARLLDDTTATASPSTFLERRAESLVVQCGDGSRELLARTCDAAAAGKP